MSTSLAIAAVVAVVRPFGGNVGVVWAFVVLYVLAFVMTYFLGVEQPGVTDKNGKTLTKAEKGAADRESASATA